MSISTFLGSFCPTADFFFGNLQRTVGFVDPSPHRSMPGWPLRNLLTLLSIRFGVEEIRVLCWKNETGTDQSRSVMVELRNKRQGSAGGYVSLASGSK